MILLHTYITFTRKSLALLSAAVFVIALICIKVYGAANVSSDAKTNADRIAFIEQYGFTLSSTEPQTKTVTIPVKFSDVYNNYNRLQQSAGYDLTAYKGCEVTLYTYSIRTPDNLSGDYVFNIMVYNNRVIGGDISSCLLGGNMLPISKNNFGS